MDQATLEQHWRKGFGPLWNKGGIDTLYDFFEDGALFVDEDNPFLLDKENFIDHLTFHRSGLWESVLWRSREERFQVFGTTGLVSCDFTTRGKPTDAGFRQRHGVCTVTCRWDDDAGQWRGVCLHLSTLLSHINACAPS